MRRVMSAAAVMTAVLLWSNGIQAQGRDFSGQWVVDAERTSAAMQAQGGGATAVARTGGGGAGGGGVGTRAVAVAGSGGGGAATVGGGERAIVAASGGGGGRGGARTPAPMAISMAAGSFTLGTGENAVTYQTNGSAQTISTPRGDIVAKSSWQGDRLVIETTSPSPDGALVTTSTTWYRDGDALVRETKSATGAVRTTFYKKAS